MHYTYSAVENRDTLSVWKLLLGAIAIGAAAFVFHTYKYQKSKLSHFPNIFKKTVYVYITT